MTTSKMIKVMQAYERGEQIEMHALDAFNDDVWDDISMPLWNWAEIEYRVKPKPKYRPYKDAKEFLNAQEKHGMWLKSNTPNVYFMPVRIVNEEVTICMVNINGDFRPHKMTFETLLEEYRWKDNQKCGVKLP